MRKVEKEKIDYIKVHKDVAPRCKLAKDAGVSLKFLYKVLHECGCDFGNKHFVPQPDKKRDKLITKLYPTHSATEIALELNCHPSTVSKAAKRLGLEHTKETEERLRAKSMENLKKSKLPDVIEKRTSKWRRTMNMEKFRIMSGIPQKTRLRISRLTTKAYHAKYNLINKHGYFAYENEPYIIGYDGKTTRVDERYYQLKYNFKFEEDKCQEN